MANLGGVMAPLVLGAAFQAAAVQYFFSESYVESHIARVSEVRKGGIAEITDGARAVGELGWPLALGAGIYAFARRPIARRVDKKFDRFFDSFVFPGLD